MALFAGIAAVVTRMGALDVSSGYNATSARRFGPMAR
jgi:hypothetical protein